MFVADLPPASTGDSASGRQSQPSSAPATTATTTTTTTTKSTVFVQSDREQETAAADSPCVEVAPAAPATPSSRSPSSKADPAQVFVEAPRPSGPIQASVRVPPPPGQQVRRDPVQAAGAETVCQRVQEGFVRGSSSSSSSPVVHPPQDRLPLLLARHLPEVRQSWNSQTERYSAKCGEVRG